jgi:DNA-binding response OmpR family regulator
MTSAHDPAGTAASPESERTGNGPRTVSVLLYSDDYSTRDAVRAAVGRRPARDVEVVRWHECATAPAVIEAADAGGYDLFVLDGEATPTGGLGLARQLKNEIFRCPPILVLTGRPQDAWLAGWSLADEVVPHPLDPAALADAVARLARGPAAVG